jgi:hypothetical protein
LPDLLSRSEFKMFKEEYPEDENPQLTEVAGARRNGKRFNSAAGFIYHYHKSR